MMMKWNRQNQMSRFVVWFWMLLMTCAWWCTTTNASASSPNAPRQALTETTTTLAATTTTTTPSDEQQQQQRKLLKDTIADAIRSSRQQLLEFRRQGTLAVVNTAEEQGQDNWENPIHSSSSLSSSSPISPLVLSNHHDHHRHDDHDYDYHRQLLTQACANAMSNLTANHEGLEQALNNVVAQVDVALEACDPNATLCVVDENGMASTPTFLQQCQLAGGAIFEYSVNLQCNLLQMTMTTTPTSATAATTMTTTTNTSTTTSFSNNNNATTMDRVVVNAFQVQYLNVDECADPMLCNGADIADAAEVQADFVLNVVELAFATLYQDTGFTVECDAQVDPSGPTNATTTAGTLRDDGTPSAAMHQGTSVGTARGRFLRLVVLLAAALVI
ncbi:hypothetical protein ACA910_011627 [Epithemia clementina (nom. ined.)]